MAQVKPNIETDISTTDTCPDSGRSSDLSSDYSSSVISSEASKNIPEISITKQPRTSPVKQSMGTPVIPPVVAKMTKLFADRQFNSQNNADRNNSKKRKRDPNCVTEIELFLDTFFTDMRVLTYFTNLIKLEVIYGNFERIEGLQLCPQLKILNMTGNRLKSLSGLDKNVELSELYIGKNDIQSLKPIASLTKLVTLDFHKNKISTLEPIAKLSQLTLINAAQNRLTTVHSVVEQLSQLYELNLAANRILHFSEIDKLAKITTIQKLYLSDPHFGDNPICAMSNYHSYIVYKMQHLAFLDGIRLDIKAKNMAKATVHKKIIFYRIRLQCEQRNCNALLFYCDALSNTVESRLTTLYSQFYRQRNLLQRCLSDDDLTKEPIEDKIQRLQSHIDQYEDMCSSIHRNIESIEHSSDLFYEKVFTFFKQELCTGGNIRIVPYNSIEKFENTTLIDMLNDTNPAINLTPMDGTVKSAPYQLISINVVENRFAQSKYQRILAKLHRGREISTTSRDTHRDLENIQNTNNSVVRSNSGSGSRLMFLDSFDSDIIQQCITTAALYGSNLTESISDILESHHNMLSQPSHKNSKYCVHILVVEVIEYKTTKKNNRSGVTMYLNPVYLLHLGVVTTPPRNSLDNTQANEEWQNTYDSLSTKLKSYQASLPHFHRHLLTQFWSQTCAKLSPLTGIDDNGSELLQMEPIASADSIADTADDNSILQSVGKGVCDITSILNSNVAETLRCVNLSFNKIESLSVLIQNCPNLETIDASFNSINSIPSDISKLSHLHTLNLQNNAIRKVDSLSHLQSCDQLTNLNLLNNTVSKTSKFAKLILSYLPTLTILNNENTAIHQSSMITLPHKRKDWILFISQRLCGAVSIISDNCTVRHFTFDDTSLKAPQTEAPPPSKIPTPPIPELPLPLVLKYPTQKFNDWKTIVTKLELSHCNLLSIPSIISELPNLVSLNLSHNVITRIQNLNANEKLSELSLAHNNLSNLDDLTEMATVNKEIIVDSNGAESNTAKLSNKHSDSGSGSGSSGGGGSASIYSQQMLKRDTHSYRRRKAAEKELETKYKSEESTMDEPNDSPMAKRGKSDNGSKVKYSGITKLDISCNKIRDLTPILKWVKSLEVLCCEWNKISDLKLLRKMTALFQLNCALNKIKHTSDIYNLRHCKRLTILDMFGNPICNDASRQSQSRHYRNFAIYCIATLRILDGTTVSSDESNIAAVQFSGRLHYDFLTEKIGHSYFNQIRMLDISSCDICVLDELGPNRFQRLCELILDNNNIVDISPICQLSTLIVLRANHNNIETIVESKKGFSQLKRLQILELNFNKIVNISALQINEMTSLHHLSLSGNRITSIEDIKPMPTLKTLNLDHNKIRRLPITLSNLPNLQKLSIENNGLRSLDNIDRLISLKTFNCNENRISQLVDLQNLFNIETMQSLSLNKNPIQRKPQFQTYLLRNCLSLKYLCNLDITEARKRMETDDLINGDIPLFAGQQSQSQSSNAQQIRYDSNLTAITELSNIRIRHFNLEELTTNHKPYKKRRR